MEPLNIDKFKGVCLSGGGSKGICHLGTLWYYHHIGLYDPDYVEYYATSSVGFPISLLLVCGYTPFEIFIEVCNVENIIDFTILKASNLYDVAEKFGALDISILTNKIEPLVYRKLSSKYGWNQQYENGDKRFPTLLELYNLTGKTLIATGSNITDVKCDYLVYNTFPDISCIEANKITCCIPGVFQRIKYNGKYYVDGGISNNFPLRQIDDGNMKILGIVLSGTDLTVSDEHFTGYMYRVVATFARSNTELRCELAGKNTTLIKCEYNKVSTFDFNLTKDQKMDLFIAGYKTAESYHNNHEI